MDLRFIGIADEQRLKPTTLGVDYEIFFLLISSVDLNLSFFTKLYFYLGSECYKNVSYLNYLNLD